MWRDGDCTIPSDPNLLTYPHKRYAAGSVPIDPSYSQIAGYFGRVAAWYRSGGFVDECGKRHTNPMSATIGILTQSGWSVSFLDLWTALSGTKFVVASVSWTPMSSVLSELV